MNILKRVTLKNVGHWMGDIFKDPMDEKLVAMFPVEAVAPRPTVAPKMYLVPTHGLVEDSNIIDLVAEPYLVPEQVSHPELTVVVNLAFDPEKAVVSEQAVAPELTIVPKRGMDAALKLSNEMVAQFKTDE